MKNYGNDVKKAVRRTPQTQPIPGREAEMIRNDAGGYVFDAGDWEFFKRFLILGTEKGSYYVGEKELTLRNVGNVLNVMKVDGIKALKIAHEFSVEGRAPKQYPILYVLACGFNKKLVSQDVRNYAASIFNDIVRTGEHLFYFTSQLDSMNIGKWDSTVKNAYAGWFHARDVNAIAFQAIKYQSRHDWTFKDVLRVAHVKPNDEAMNELFKWIVGKLSV